MAIQNDIIIINELLFYIHNKIHATTKDAIVENCVKFYSLSEITDAISVYESALKIRLSKRNKSDDLQCKLLNDLYDKIWSLDASNTQIPLFVAADLSRVPREREGTDSPASIEQILASIHGMKSTISFLKDNMITRVVLENSLAALSTTSGSSSPSTAAAASSVTSTDAAGASESLPTLPSLPPPRHPSAPPIPLSPSAPDGSDFAAGSVSDLPTLPVLSNKKYADITKKQNEKMPRPQRQSGKPPTGSRGGRSNSIVIGKKVNAGVVSWKGADLTITKYIGRCAMGTTTDDIKATLEANSV